MDNTLSLGPGIQINPITGAIIPAGLRVDTLGNSQYVPGPQTGGVAAPVSPTNGLVGDPLSPTGWTPDTGPPSFSPPPANSPGALTGTPPAPLTPDQQAANAAAPVGAMSGTPPSPIGAALSTPPTPAPPPAPKAPAQAAAPAPVQPGPQAAPPADAAGVNLPIGLRLNNPLNLKAVPGQPFVDSSDPSGFGHYPDLASGVAGAVHQLGLYGQRGINTVHSIVSTWAPANDGNNPDNYSAFVAKKMGVDPNAPLNLQDPKTLSGLVGAMAQMETGRPLPPDVLAAGVSAGLTGKMPTIEPTAATADNGGFIGGPGGDMGHDAFLQDILGRMNATMGDLKPITVPPVTQSQELMALASGLLSGRSFGQGLARGLQGMNALQMANRQGQVQQAQLNNQQTLAKAGLLSDQMRTALMMRPRMGYPLTNAQGKTMMSIMYPDGSMGFQPLPDGFQTPQAMRAQQGQQRLYAQTNGTIANATAGAKADQEELSDLLHDGPVALQTIQNDAKMRAALNQGGAIMGPGALNAFKRWAVEQGFPVEGVNQDDKSYLMALINQQKTANVGLMKTAVGSRVTNIEAKMGAAQGITPEMTKEAADAILDLQDLRSSVDAQVYKAYASDPNIKQTIAAAGGMRAWRAAQETKILAGQTGQLRDNPAAPGSPLPQVNPDGSYTSVGPSGQKITVTVIH